MNSSSDAPARGAGNKIKIYLIGIAVVLILGAILYFVGLQAGRAQLGAQAAKFEVERNGLNSKVTTAQSERDAARDRAALMETRAALYRTAIDLDARNFGTANTHLKEAATALGRVKTPDTSQLRGEIEATDLNVAVNLGGQRAKVLSFADQLNQIIPVEIETTAPGVTSSPGATASMPEDVNSATSTLSGDTATAPATP